MFSLKVASVGGDRLLSSDDAIVPTISGNSFSDTIFRASSESQRQPTALESLGLRARDAA